MAAADQRSHPPLGRLAPLGDAGAPDDDLAVVGDAVRTRFQARHEAREQAYTASREATRSAANAIRAIHRGEVGVARDLLDASWGALERGVAAAEPYPEVRYGGMLQDAAKEHAEARLTLAAVSGEPFPGPDALGIDDGSWLHGLAETVGELRRQALDHVRADDLDEAERLLGLMDDILAVLATIDVPDGLTRGLRRAADAARAIAERTRGDVTTAQGQHRLRAALDAHATALREAHGDRA